MRFLTCTPSSARTAPAESERGAVAVFVAVLLVAVFGLGALVIDIGMLYQEEAELQTGADSAALALAYDCLTLGTTTACTDNTTTREHAQFFAEANSTDGYADVLDIVFGTDGYGVPTVTVALGTRAKDGGDEIDFALAPVIGTDSATLHTEATARWGVPSDLEPSPFAIGLCEWENATSDGTDFGVTAEANISLRIEASVPLHCLEDDGSALLDSLLLGGTADDALGGFSYLRSDGNCVAVVVDGHAEQEILLNEELDITDALTTLGCLLEDLLFSDYLIVPIFDGVTVGNPPGCPSPVDIAGIPYCYRIYGYSAFRMAAFDSDLLEDLLGVEPALLSAVLAAMGISFGGDAVPFLDGGFEKVVLQDYNGAIDPDAPDLGLTTVQLTD